MHINRGHSTLFSRRQRARRRIRQTNLRRVGGGLGGEGKKKLLEQACCAVLMEVRSVLWEGSVFFTGETAYVSIELNSLGWRPLERFGHGGIVGQAHTGRRQAAAHTAEGQVSRVIRCRV